MVICVWFCFMDRKRRFIDCVEDIKEINYIVCGYYLYRIKLFGLGNILFVRILVWVRDIVF